MACNPVSFDHVNIFVRNAERVARTNAVPCSAPKNALSPRAERAADER